MGVLLTIYATIGIFILLCYAARIVLFLVMLPFAFVSEALKKENRKNVILMFVSLSLFSFACWLWFGNH